MARLKLTSTAHYDSIPSTKTKNQVERGFLLDVVITESTAVLQLLACKDKTLLIRGDALLILDLSLHIVNGVGWLHIQGDGFSRQSLHKDLHPAAEAENQVERGLLLDVIITESTAVLQLLASKDKTLLIRGDALLILDLGLHIVNGVGWLHIQGDGFSRQSLH